MYEPSYPVRTERLLLRPLDPATDIDAVFAYQSRADVCRYIPYEPRTRDQVAERLAKAARDHTGIGAEGDALLLAVVVEATGVLVGDVMLAWTSQTHRTVEIGYVIDPAHQGNGYVTEAAAALLALAFDGLDAHRVIGRIDDANTASAAVLRRLGMRHEATLIENEWFKGRWSTELDFAILQREWREAQARHSSA